MNNVLIYFDTAAKTELLARLRQVVASDGFLVLGEMESIVRLTNQFRIPDGNRVHFRPA
jgi:chemotaxis methyl-accepting protein methylase